MDNTIPRLVLIVIVMSQIPSNLVVVVRLAGLDEVIVVILLVKYLTVSLLDEVIVVILLIS